MKTLKYKNFAFYALTAVTLACSLPGVSTTGQSTSTPMTATPAGPVIEPTGQVATPTLAPTIEPATATAEVSHSLVPSISVSKAQLEVNDVVSADTAAENRAPYGDAYNNNLFERPFTKDMTYVPDLDIISYSLAYDKDFFYVSIQLVGSDPNNALGIDYAVELDINGDGFGDDIIIARSPHDINWSTEAVQIVEDTNRDTGGLSAERSDAPLPGDGYDTLIFDGSLGGQVDPDLAWVRINAGKKATVQFAFKRTFSGGRFMLGVLADSGLKSIEDLDYVDRYTEEQAGSPEKSEKDYPLKAVYGVDNVCREAFGFVGTGDEPQRCASK